jgi:hypothetical protein
VGNVRAFNSAIMYSIYASADEVGPPSHAFADSIQEQQFVPPLSTSYAAAYSLSPSLATPTVRAVSHPLVYPGLSSWFRFLVCVLASMGFAFSVVYR